MRNTVCTLVLSHDPLSHDPLLPIEKQGITGQDCVYMLYNNCICNDKGPMGRVRDSLFILYYIYVICYNLLTYLLTQLYMVIRYGHINERYMYSLYMSWSMQNFIDLWLAHVYRICPV